MFALYSVSSEIAKKCEVRSAINIDHRKFAQKCKEKSQKNIIQLNIYVIDTKFPTYIYCFARLVC